MLQPLEGRLKVDVDHTDDVNFLQSPSQTGILPAKLLKVAKPSLFPRSRK